MLFHAALYMVSHSILSESVPRTHALFHCRSEGADDYQHSDYSSCRDCPLLEKNQKYHCAEDAHTLMLPPWNHVIRLRALVSCALFAPRPLDCNTHISAEG